MTVTDDEKKEIAQRARQHPVVIMTLHDSYLYSTSTCNALAWTGNTVGSILPT
jgi:hypothetical protein